MSSRREEQKVRAPSGTGDENMINKIDEFAKLAQALSGNDGDWDTGNSVEDKVLGALTQMHKMAMARVDIAQEQMKQAAQQEAIASIVADVVPGIGNLMKDVVKAEQAATG